VALASGIEVGNDSLFLTSTPAYQLEFLGDKLLWLDPSAGPTVGFGKTGQLVFAPKGTTGPTGKYYEPTGVSLIDFSVVGTEVFVMQTTTGGSTSGTQILSVAAAGAPATLVAEAPAGTAWNPLLTRLVAADATHLYIQALSKVIATNVESEQIIRITRAGGAQQVLTTKNKIGMSNTTRLGDTIYFQSKQGFGSLYRVPADGSSADVRLTPDANGDGVDDDAKCLTPFFHSSGIYCQGAFELTKYDLNAQNPVVIRDERTLEPTPPYIGRISSIEGDKVYQIFSAGQTKSWPIQRITTTSGATPVNVSCDRRIVLTALNDDSNIYWLERNKSDAPATLYRGPK
jgi:hypothetical protein